MKAFRVTYNVVTPESAEDGDVADSGFVMPGNWHVTVDTAEDKAAVMMDLRSAVSLVGRGIMDVGSWFEQSESDTDWRTGAETRLSLHPPDTITRASYRRLARLLTGR